MDMIQNILWILQLSTAVVRIEHCASMAVLYNGQYLKLTSVTHTHTPAALW